MEQEPNSREESTIKTIEFYKVIVIIFVAVITTAVIVGGGVYWWVSISFKQTKDDSKDDLTVMDSLKQEEEFNGPVAEESGALPPCFTRDYEKPIIDSSLDTSQWQQFKHGFIGEIAYPTSVKIEFIPSKGTEEYDPPDKYKITSVHDIDTSAFLRVYDLKTMAYTYSSIQDPSVLFYDLDSNRWYWYTGRGFANCAITIAGKTEGSEPIYSYGANSHGYQLDTFIIVDRATDDTFTMPRLYEFHIIYGHPDTPRIEDERELSRQFEEEIKTMIRTLRFYRTKG